MVDSKPLKNKENTTGTKTRKKAPLRKHETDKKKETEQSKQKSMQRKTGVRKSKISDHLKTNKKKHILRRSSKLIVKDNPELQYSSDEAYDESDSTELSVDTPDESNDTSASGQSEGQSIMSSSFEEGDNSGVEEV